MSLAQTLARFTRTAVPGETALQMMRVSLYDWAACGIAGANEPVARILRRSKPQQLGAMPVFGSKDTYAPADAALINGATSHAMDYDDTHFAHIGHPSVAVIPAALCFARSLEDLIEAALIGAELSIRIGEWLGREHYQIGFHQTATAGAFGAAAAAGRLAGLSETDLEAAFSVAATQAAGLKSQFGTMGKPYHAGLAARTGVEAVTLARAGFDTRGAGLDGPQGFGPTHHGAGDLTAFDSLGAAWRMETVSHKFHACCHGLHAMLEALSGYQGNADTVQITTHPRWLTVCNIADPVTGLEAKFSYRHTAAMAVSGISTAALESYTDALANDPGLVALRQKIEVQADPRIPETGAEIRIADQTLTHDLSAPLSFEIRQDRLRAKGTALLGNALEGRLWHAVTAHDLEALKAMIKGAE